MYRVHLSFLSGREGCLAEVLFLPLEDLHSCKATVDKHKITGITKDEFVSEAEVFSNFNKKEKTVSLESSGFGRLTKYISTLVFKSLKYLGN